jgi:hypothetical protein
MSPTQHGTAPAQLPEAGEHAVHTCCAQVPLQQSLNEEQPPLAGTHAVCTHRSAPLHDDAPVQVERSHTHAPEAHFSPGLHAGLQPDDAGFSQTPPALHINPPQHSAALHRSPSTAQPPSPDEPEHAPATQVCPLEQA